MNTIRPNLTINAILGCLIFWFTGLFASNAYALDPDQAISQFFDSPTVVQTRNYNVFSGGGFHMRIPRETAQLVNISPPRLSAGCSGIDATLGGFSFISADKFVQMLRSIMQNAQGYAIQIGITTLCPMCADIINKMEEVARMMNGFNIESCKAAQGLVNSTLGGADRITGTNLFESRGVGGEENGASISSTISSGIDTAAAWLTASGTKNSTEAANMSQTEAKNELNEAFAAVADDIEDMLNGNNAFASDDANIEKLKGISDRTSSVLTDIAILGYGDQSSKHLASILLSIAKPVLPKGKTDSEVKVRPQNLIDVDELISYMIYGKTPYENAKLVNLDLTANNNKNMVVEPLKSNQSVPSYLNKRVLVCPFSNSLNPYNCTYDSSQKLTLNQFIDSTSGVLSSPLIKEGIFFFIAKSLDTAITKIHLREPIPAETISLMNITNQPVYKLLKIESIYPGTTQDMINHYAHLISLEIVRALFEALLDEAEAIASEEEKTVSETLNKFVGLKGEVPKAIASFFNELNFREKALENNLIQANALWQQIRILETVIARTASQQGVADKLMFSRSSPLTGR